jgi:hypothetical protein
VFIWLGLKARVPTLNMNFGWVGVLTLVMVLTAAVCGWALHRKTGFS